MSNRWLRFLTNVKLKKEAQLRMKATTNKKLNCRKNESISPRERCIALLEAMSIYKNEGDEKWKELPGVSNYLVSSWCRLKSLQSFGGKCRILSPSIKNGKYLYYTVSINGKRYCISISFINNLFNYN